MPIEESWAAIQTLIQEGKVRYEREARVVLGGLDWMLTDDEIHAIEEILAPWDVSSGG